MTTTLEVKPEDFLKSKKIGSDLHDSTQLGGCVAPTCTPKEIYLNVSALSDSRSLIPPITLASYLIPVSPC